MSDLAALIADVDESSPASLYDELAPLYDFVYERHYDYDATAAVVDEYAPANARRVLVGACGTGHLVARLDDRYDDVVGVDLHPAMLALAADRTDAELVAADLRDYVPDEPVDAYTLLGNALIHFDDDAAVRALFDRVLASLAPGGAFLCDFIPADTFVNGYASRDRFESERYRVDRTVVTVATGERGATGIDAHQAFAYRMADDDTGATARTGELMPGRFFDGAALRDLAADVGFDDARLVGRETNHDGLLVARRAA